jgi:hypothetical protein
MPGSTLFLAKLKDVTPQQFLATIPKSNILWAGKIQKTIIKPTIVDAEVLNSSWDIGFLTLAGVVLDKTHIEKVYSVSAGIPQRILDVYVKNNQSIRGQPLPPLPITKGTIPSPSNAVESSVPTSLEANSSLLTFAQEFVQKNPRKDSNVSQPVTMINLLHFHRNPDAKKEYFLYGQAFAPVAGALGGWAKIVGNVVEPRSGTDSRNGRQDWWDEVSIVHYPSINSFVEMSLTPAYQDANKTHRLKALQDTALICTVEMDLDSARL